MYSSLKLKNYNTLRVEIQVLFIGAERILSIIYNSGIDFSGTFFYYVLEEIPDSYIIF